MNDSTDTPAEKPPAKQENFLLNLALNIIIPTVILTKFSGDDHFGPTWGVVVALSFPIMYGIYDFYRVGKINFFSALGVVSVLLTGGISLLELDPKYIAIKEAAIPALFGIATLISLKTKYPLVRTFLYNDKILQVDKVSKVLRERNNKARFDRTLFNASLMIAGSFLLSSILNYILAKWIVVSQPGTEEYAAQLGKMTALSYPIILLPSMAILMGALFYLFKQIKSLTGLPLEEIIVHHETKD